MSPEHAGLSSSPQMRAIKTDLSSTPDAASGERWRRRRSRLVRDGTRPGTGIWQPACAAYDHRGRLPLRPRDEPGCERWWRRPSRRTRRRDRCGVPRTIVPRGATRCWPARWCGRSPPENLAFDPVPDVSPGLELNRSGFNGRDPPFDLDVPRRFGIRVWRAIETAKEFSGNLGASIEIQEQGLGKNGASRLRHVVDCNVTGPRSRCRRCGPTATSCATTGSWRGCAKRSPPGAPRSAVNAGGNRTPTSWTFTRGSLGQGVRRMMSLAVLPRHGRSTRPGSRSPSRGGSEGLRRGCRSSCWACQRSQLAWRFIQNMGVVSSNRPSRRADRAVTPRRPRTSSLTRVTGMFIRRAASA